MYNNIMPFLFMPAYLATYTFFWAAQENNNT